MKVLPLTKRFAKGRDCIDFDLFYFNGGEPHITIKEKHSHVLIYHAIEKAADLIVLCVAVDALRRCGYKIIKLSIPYFPGARQDRVANPGEALTVKVYADIINSLELDGVWILDPHSDVTPALIDRCSVVEPMLYRILGELPVERPCLAIPDAGATKRIVSMNNMDLRMIQCLKTRDVSTGKLSGFEVPLNVPEYVLIIDDICDGGGTFLGLAEKLKEAGAKHLYLYVSHGIFSNGVKSLLEHFDIIVTTDSFVNSVYFASKHTQIKIIKI